MKPASESRFLQSFLTVAASAVLVCGALVLLTSTSPWTPRDETETQAPMAAPANASNTNAPGARQPSDATAMTEEHVEIAQTVQTSSERDQPAATTELTTPEAVKPVGASDMPQLPTISGTDTEAIDAESMAVSDPESADTPAETGAVSDIGAGGEPEMAVATKPAIVAADEPGKSLKESQPAAIAGETVSDDAGASANPSLTAPTAAEDKANETRQTASPEMTALALPSPPMPKRKPKTGPSTSAATTHAAPPSQRPSRSETSKQDQPRTIVAQQAPAQPGSGRWLPMALAPADKPLPSQPVRLSGASYASKVWAALARHKLRAGQNGSATVVFSIGAGGGLGSVTIGTSSGNAKIDQLALATVRGAAPFPPPPSGAASFSIRIDFQ